MEKKHAWLEFIGLFKVGARFYWFRPLTLVFSYNNCIPLGFWINALAQLVERNVCKHWDLGSIPRSPPFSILFCFPCSYAACLPGVHHTSTIQACHMAQETNLKVTNQGPGNTPVNACARGQKSQKRLAFHGPDCWKIPPKLGSTPPIGLHFIFHSFYFFYFICFI